MKIQSDIQVKARWFVKDGHFDLVLNDGTIVAEFTPDEMSKFRFWSMTVATPGAIYYLPRAQYELPEQDGCDHCAEHNTE